jgi:hypothetical protein
LNKKIIGSVVITGMLTAGLTGCGTNQQAQDQNRMQRVQYQTQNQTGQNGNNNNLTQRPYVDRTRAVDPTHPYDERYVGYRDNNQNFNGNMRVGQNNNNNFMNTDQNNTGNNRIGTGQNMNNAGYDVNNGRRYGSATGINGRLGVNDTSDYRNNVTNNTNTGTGAGGRLGLNDPTNNGFGGIRNDFGIGNNTNNGNNGNNGQNAPQISLSGNQLTIPKNSLVSRNNVNYVDISRYCNLASTQEQMNARKINYGRVSTNGAAEKYNPVPMGSINLPGCTSFVEFDAANPNLIYVKDAPTDNSLVSKPITISNNEAIKIENGRVLCPVSTLQKIVAQKTATNPNSLKVNLQNK